MHELSKLAGLKIALVIYDSDHNIMQEFNTSNDFTVEAIYHHKLGNEMLKLDNAAYKNICRKKYP